MYTRIGSTSCRNAQCLLSQLLPGSLKSPLHRGLIRLHLPACVCSAVVSYGQLNPASRHGHWLARNCRLRANEQLRDLHGVRGRTFAEVVTDAPEREAVVAR